MRYVRDFLIPSVIPVHMFPVDLAQQIISEAKLHGDPEFIKVAEELTETDTPRKVFFLLQNGALDEDTQLIDILSKNTLRAIIDSIHEYEDESVNYADYPINLGPYCHGTDVDSAYGIITHGLLPRFDEKTGKIAPQNIDDPLLFSYPDRVYLGTSTPMGLGKCIRAAMNISPQDATLIFFNEGIERLSTYSDEDCLEDAPTHYIMGKDKYYEYQGMTARESAERCGSFAVREEIDPEYIDVVDPSAKTEFERKAIPLHKKGSAYKICNYLVRNRAYESVEDCVDVLREIMAEDGKNPYEGMFDHPTDHTNECIAHGQGRSSQIDNLGV